MARTVQSPRGEKTKVTPKSKRAASTSVSSVSKKKAKSDGDEVRDEEKEDMGAGGMLSVVESVEVDDGPLVFTPTDL